MCGVTGLKPTWGRVPRTGAMPLCHSLDTIGPLARSAEDCARLLALIAGPDGHDPLLQQPAPGFESLLRAPAGGLRLGVARAFIDAAEPAVADADIHRTDTSMLEGLLYAVMNSIQGPTAGVSQNSR